MTTAVLDVCSAHEKPQALAHAAEVLRGGGLVAFPTETVYGLGANALDGEAVARIFTAKGRPANNPLIVHVAKVEDVRRLVAHWPAEAAALAERFWPGPLTLVLPKRADVPEIVTAGGPTVAVRMPGHAVARELIELAGVPVAAPSANRSGNVSPTLAQHVIDELDGRIDLILDGGPTTGGIESTVLDLSRRPARLLRPGLVTPGEIEAVIGPVVRPGPVAPALAEALPSPGMLTRHYAPKTPVELVEGPLRERLAEFLGRGMRLALLSRDDDWQDDYPDEDACLRWNMPDEPQRYAARLYQVLRTIDRRGAYDRILVLMPPDTEEWLAVRDRLRRAAAPA
jgi:L-threonylcarbamoyladenylate synthase